MVHQTDFLDKKKICLNSYLISQTTTNCRRFIDLNIKVKATKFLEEITGEDLQKLGVGK